MPLYICISMHWDAVASSFGNVFKLIISFNIKLWIKQEYSLVHPSEVITLHHKQTKSLRYVDQINHIWRLQNTYLPDMNNSKLMNIRNLIYNSVKSIHPNDDVERLIWLWMCRKTRLRIQHFSTTKIDGRRIIAAAELSIKVNSWRWSIVSRGIKGRKNRPGSELRWKTAFARHFLTTSSLNCR